MHLIFQQYEERLQRRQAKPSTLTNMRRTAALFEESGLDPLTAEDWQIEEWLAGLRASRGQASVPHQEGACSKAKPLGAAEHSTGLAPRTIRLHFENLNAVYGYAVYRRQLERSPMEAVRLPREPDKEPRILTNDELRYLLGNCMTAPQWLMLHLLIYTGMRRSEVRNLQWPDVKPDTITVRQGKGDKLRHIPIHPALAEALAEHKPNGGHVLPGRGGEPMSDSGLFSRLKKVSGDVHCRPHDFRRTVATSLAEQEVAPNVIDKIMGWSARTVGSRYYIRTADRRMQEAILKLYADDPLTPAGGR